MKYLSLSLYFTLFLSGALWVKAALEMWYFHDRKDAVQTLKYWAAIAGTLLFTLAFSLLCDYLSKI